MSIQPASLSRMMQLLKEKKEGVEQLDMEIVPGKLYREKETGRYLVVESLMNAMPTQLRQIVFWYIDTPDFNQAIWNQDAYRNWEEA